ncbi:MAG: class A beta-lactamase-related serine hydrolase [Patescibacteria group bacterium]|nr:class A beta-lactamase-related serine hydrolase [Patescibacteria group bacterium]MDD5715667.1 class A beta-lactamase-related serine hydrolase [Patescibacteria group bacterium]
MKKSTIISAALSCVIGVVIGWFGYSALNNEGAANSRGLPVRQGGYEFINPLLECEINAGLESIDLKSFKGTIEQEVHALLSDTAISHISVYYRDLNNGPWYGINEKENFKPASLLKVPVMIAYYKMAETDPAIFDTSLTVNPTQSTGSNTSENLTAGANYSVQQLIEIMIVRSDNLAFEMLAGNIGDERIQQIHRDLGLTTISSDTPEDFISVKAYASLFRILYNASYLNRDMSEKALELLSRSDFNYGLAAGVPGSIKIANKFGVVGAEGDGTKQLHDCGIIYYPNHPYLLCIMTRGGDMNKLTSAIGTISSTIFGEIEKKYGTP